MPLPDLLRSIALHEPRLQSRLRQLVEIESPSDDPAAVNRAADLVASWARELGAAIKRHPQKAFGDILELRFGPHSRTPASGTGRILLLGHLDTVWPTGTLAHMPWRQTGTQNGTQLHGPGILDMKAGVVMAIEAIAAARELPPRHKLSRPITLLLVSDEEVGSPVSRPITERIARTSDAVFVLEPAQGLAYKTARKGVGHFHLRVTGVAAHAGVDFHSGHSAILEMARLIDRISALTDPARGITVNVGVVHGGTRSNVIAAHCTAEVDLRIARASDAARIERRIRSLKPSDKACSLTISGGINRPPMERRAGTVRLFRQARKLAAQLGLDLQEASTGGGSDGNFTAALGIPTLDGMGAVGAGAHAPHEHVVARHLVERTALLAAMLAAPPQTQN
jgi:glutamate carboxypeptidase